MFRRVFRKLARHDIRRWALTGGLAFEIHALRLCLQPSRHRRTLNDLDFIADSFDCIPETLPGDFLFRHVHPLEPHGKTMLQLIVSRLPSDFVDRRPGNERPVSKSPA
jgi:hypothetical protein